MGAVIVAIPNLNKVSLGAGNEPKITQLVVQMGLNLSLSYFEAHVLYITLSQWLKDYVYPVVRHISFLVHHISEEWMLMRGGS